jgi:hypothetical protein
MCYLLFAKKLNKTAKNKTIIDILEDKLLFNKDGSGYLTNTGKTLRTLDNKEFVKNIKKDIKKSDWLISHLRFATNGSKTVDNVHLFEQAGYTFAHNGIISSFSDKKLSQTKSDSLLYFESLVDSIKCNDENHIVKRIKKSNFFNGGRAFLLDDKNKMYIYGDFHVYIIDNWFVISSAGLYFESNKSKKYGDIKLDLDGIYQQKVEGIYCVDTNKKKLDFKYKGEMTKYQYQDVIGFKDTFYNKYDDFDYDYGYNGKSLYNMNKDRGF